MTGSARRSEPLPAGYRERLEQVKSEVRTGRLRGLRRRHRARRPVLAGRPAHPGPAGPAAGWRTRVSVRLAQNLRAEFPQMRGLSRSGERDLEAVEQENAFYADADNQVPKDRQCAAGPSSASPCPCASPKGLLREIRDHAAADDRSVSNWIRRAVEHELARNRG